MLKRQVIMNINRHLLQQDDTDTVIDEKEIEERDGDVLILAFCFLIIGIIIGYLYESYSIFKKIERYFPHASANMIIGFIVGGILASTGTLIDVFTFDSEFFFIYLLPPIIFSAGYNLPKDFFFHNFGSIMVFAFVGTTLSAFFIGATLTAFGEFTNGIYSLSFTKNMMIGSLISAVDPVAVILVLKSLNVDEQLKVLLFGESVLNDAASVVINRVFVEIEAGGKTTSQALAPAIPQIIGIAVASMLIGTIISLFVAAIHKYSSLKNKKVYEIELAAFLIGAFLPYGIAEAFGLSGICSVLFAGIMTDYYTYHHLSRQSQITTRHIVSTLAYMAELFVFIYLGMSFFLEEGHEFKSGYVIFTLILCFIGRAISVFPLAFLLNIGRKHKLPFKHQAVLWYSGLRGPVAYALAIATPEDLAHPEANNIIITTTIFIVAFTTLMLGGLAFPFLRWLKPPIMRSTSQTKTDTYDISNHWFNRLDRRFLRPWFGPKVRRNVNHPLTSMDEIELDDIKQQELKNKQLSSNLTTNNDINGDSNTHHVQDANTTMINTKNIKKKYDMKYIKTSRHEDEADEVELNMDNKSTPNKKSTGNLTSSSTNKHLKITENKTNIDYSMPRTKAPSFIDNPQEQSRSGTWSNINDINVDQSTSTLQAPSQITGTKSVTPPPVSTPMEDNDIISSININD